MDESRKGKAIKSAFHGTAFEADVSIHVDRKVGSATISPSGRDVALASTDGLDIIDLDFPLNPPRHLRHGLPWLVADVQWSPFAARDYWVVSTANQKALVWNLNMQDDTTQGAIEHTLHGHSRAITDINFSAHHADMLATCAVDGYVHCWDLRRPRQPVLTFCDWFAGATQVKYNRQDPHILASSHDQWLRIWDDRKGAEPLRSINAHESKIYGVDWNRTRATGLVTCSLDKSIKFWDYGNESDEPERIIRTDFPVWRARHTPFGWGLLAMPQDTPGELHLYERRVKDGEIDSRAQAVKTFQGHGNHKVKEFLWRSRGGITDNGVDNRDFQLVSWGDDNHLRLQSVDPEILDSVGHVKGSQLRKNLNITRRGAIYKTFRTIENTSTEKRAATMTGPQHGSSGLQTITSSIGINKLSLPHIARTHMTIRAPAMKAKDKSKKPDEQNQKQIGWMSGIKFSKQENCSSTQKRPTSRRLSNRNPEFAEDGDWDGPESLQDEIIRIHDQLPKITFDDVNMDKRIAAVSMNGPWGENGAPIYITATVSFPEQYPETKAPTFTLGKTTLMSDEVYSKLKREVQQIASGFVTRRQGCLEAALCYLLGEVDLDTSTTFLKGLEDIDDDLDGLADESSSDDDDDDATDMPTGTSAMMSQELDSSATEDMLSVINRNANVPLPRLCGARFSMNGKLACFFPPKEDKVKSLLKSLGNQNGTRSKGGPIFETFGRLANNTSPVPRVKLTSLTSEGRDESDASDDSELLSSSDSDSSQFPVARFPMVDYFHRSTRGRYMKASPTLLSQRSSAGGTGTGTNTGTGTGISRNRFPKPKNILSLHNVSSLLPSKAELASEYYIYGDGPEVCNKNADVAEKHGFNDLADVWRYAAMLLHNEVPLEVLAQTQHHESILVIAKESIKKYSADAASDSGVDMSDDPSRRNSLSGRVKWGNSPLARKAISDLFGHFEKLADIQMLAMLSCVFSEPATPDATAQIEASLSTPQTPLMMKTPAFSLDYFPTNAAAWSMYQKGSIPSSSTSKLAQIVSGLYGSLGSSNGPWGSDPASTSYSFGDTPPLISNRTSSEHLTTQSLSTSPENPRNLRRANSGIASTFAASFSRPFSMTASSSPPNPPPTRKRPSPVESMLNSLAPSAITWGNTTVLGSVKEHGQTTAETLSYSDDEEVADGGQLAMETRISVVVENQNVFDDEGCMRLPLLDPRQAALYAAYRSSYANLLFIWRHPLARLEILKFNGLKDYFYEVDIPDNKSFATSLISNESGVLNQQPSPSSPIILGKTDQPMIPSELSHQGLDVTGYCLKHESRLEPLNSGTAGGGVGRCERCKTVQRQLRCTICMEPISAVFSSCLSCGCANHQHCLAEYLSFGNTDCPGGCECDCSRKASEGIVESWEVMLSALERMRLLDVNRVEKEKIELEDWDTEDKSDTQVTHHPSKALSKGYSTLSRRLGRVRTGEWGTPGGKKKANSLRKQDLF